MFRPTVTSIRLPVIEIIFYVSYRCLRFKATNRNKISEIKNYFMLILRKREKSWKYNAVATAHFFVNQVNISYHKYYKSRGQTTTTLRVNLCGSTLAVLFTSYMSPWYSKCLVCMQIQNQFTFVYSYCCLKTFQITCRQKNWFK